MWTRRCWELSSLKNTATSTGWCFVLTTVRAQKQHCLPFWLLMIQWSNVCGSPAAGVLRLSARVQPLVKRWSFWTSTSRTFRYKLTSDARFPHRRRGRIEPPGPTLDVDLQVSFAFGDLLIGPRHGQLDLWADSNLTSCQVHAATGDHSKLGQTPSNVRFGLSIATWPSRRRSPARASHDTTEHEGTREADPGGRQLFPRALTRCCWSQPTN